MKLYGFPASPNTWKVRAVAAHLGDAAATRTGRPDQGRARRTTSRSIRPAARRRWSTAISSCGNRPRSCSTSPARSRTRCGRTTPARAPTSCAGKAGTWRIGARTVRTADLPAAGERLLNSDRPTRRWSPRASKASTARRRVLDAHLAKQPYLVGKASRSPISRSRRRCSTPSRRRLPVAPYCAPAGLVRPRLGAAGLAGNCAAAARCRGVAALRLSVGARESGHPDSWRWCARELVPLARGRAE